MANNHTLSIDPGQPMVYEITLDGHLGDQWAEWFGGVAITRADSGETQLICSVVDQAALYGLLKKVRDLGLPLVSVIRMAQRQD